MIISFVKYHALRNDFLVVEAGARRLSTARLERMVVRACDRRAGVGADGILYLSSSKLGERRADVYNADGSWAEKSGNGLRIVGYHEYLKKKTRKTFTFEMGGQASTVQIGRRNRGGHLVTAEVGVPTFRTPEIPVRSKQPFMIQAPLKLGGLNFPVTCLAVGNPHAVLFVDNFDFDWQALGEEIEHHRLFPERTNVEFVKVINRKTLRVAEWERGAGATGSSGTGAAAAVAAGVMSGVVGRTCDVQFKPGNLHVHWRDHDDMIELTGPVEHICEGSFEFK